MCDSFLALGGATLGGHTLHAKNSDRERDEAQFLEVVGGADHAEGATVRATYIAIPQARRTAAVLLSRPFWTWGAEMGTNEHGVVIGNQALHSHIPAGRRPALTGMDLVRLGLERAESAAAAVAVIVALLERHGQGGNCGLRGRLYYHNGFIIADRTEAYVLETVGRWWIVERVVATRALSNAYSIGTDFAAVAGGLRDHAAAMGWADAGGRVDHAARLIDTARDAVTCGRARCARGSDLLGREAGRLTAAAMMAILRDHGAGAGEEPAEFPREVRGRTICMHAGAGPRRGQTTAAMVSELRPGAVLHWVTGSSAPCTGIFKPLVLRHGLPGEAVRPAGRYDPRSLWWRHERLHRAVIADFPRRMAIIRDERAAVEARFRDRIEALWQAEGPHSGAMAAAVSACWDEAAAIEAGWARALAAAPPASPGGRAHARSWSRHNALAGLPRLS
ncbi:MAG: C69 family dipeptidase [Rhodobacteraceae bacterium]|nr:C69 family dipeptidase [Paracoccaceae bacterium]